MTGIFRLIILVLILFVLVYIANQLRIIRIGIISNGSNGSNVSNGTTIKEYGDNIIIKAEGKIQSGEDYLNSKFSNIFGTSTKSLI